MIQTTPALSFKKVEPFGYSLNGKEFLVCQENQEKCNSSYTQVADTYNGTTVKILSGINGSKAQNKANRPFLKTVDTGWTDRSSEVVSNIVTLWGMADLDNKQTDVYTLSLSDLNMGKGAFGLTTKSKGKWINAVDKNKGGMKKYIAGPWKKGYELGTYGFDVKTDTAWAVINYNGQFAAARLEK